MRPGPPGARRVRSPPGPPLPPQPANTLGSAVEGRGPFGRVSIAGPKPAGWLLGSLLPVCGAGPRPVHRCSSARRNRAAPPRIGPRRAGTADRAGPAQMGPQSMLPSSANQAGRRGRSPHAGHAPRPRAGSDQGLLSLGLAQASGRYNDYNIVVNCYDIVMNFTML